MDTCEARRYLLHRGMRWLFWTLLAARILWPVAAGLLSSVALDVLTPAAASPMVVAFPDKAVINLALAWRLGDLLLWLLVTFSLMRVVRQLPSRLPRAAFSVAAALVVFTALLGVLVVIFPANTLLGRAFLPMQYGNVLCLLLGLGHIVAMAGWWLWLRRITMLCVLISFCVVALATLAPSTASVLLPLALVGAPEPILTLVLVGALVLALRPATDPRRDETAHEAPSHAVFLLHRALRRLFWAVLALTVLFPGLRWGTMFYTMDMAIRLEWVWPLLLAGLEGLLLVATALVACAAVARSVRLWLGAAVACFALAAICDLFFVLHPAFLSGLDAATTPQATGGGIAVPGFMVPESIRLLRSLAVSTGLLGLVIALGHLFHPPRWWLWIRWIAIGTLLIQPAVDGLRATLGSFDRGFGLWTLGTLAAVAAPPLLIVLAGHVLLVFRQQVRGAAETGLPPRTLN